MAFLTIVARLSVIRRGIIWGTRGNYARSLERFRGKLVEGMTGMNDFPLFYHCFADCSSFLVSRSLDGIQGTDPGLLLFT